MTPAIGGHIKTSMPLTASVECGKYFKADRGTLKFEGGNLRFEASGRCFFDIPLSSIQKIVWHWYSFSGAFEATIAGRKYFLSFVPRGADLDSWYAGLATGRRWRAVLEGRPAPERGPTSARLLKVLFGIAQIFLLGCGALLWLNVAIDPSSSTFYRILAGAGALVATITAVVLIGQGMIAIGAVLHGKISRD